MANETKVIIGVMVTTIAILIGGIFFLNSPQSNSVQSSTLSDQPVSIDYTKGQKYGPDDAQVKLVEFGDFQCPACAAAEPTIKNILAANYPNFQFIFRNYPLPQHKNAQAAANLAAYAATQNKFWEIAPRLFETQSQWQNLGDPNEYFMNLATEVQLDPNAAKEAVQKQLYRDLIQADLNEGTSIGVNSTPTFYLNGKKVNVRNFDEIKGLVEKELEALATPTPAASTD